MLTIEYLRQCLEYDPASGSLTWLPRPRDHFLRARRWEAWLEQRSGKSAYSPGPHGYLIVQINGKSWRAHRIVWAVAHGIDLSDVPDEIDHRDLDKTNNRLANLRAATHAQNAMNKPTQSNNVSGHKGVGWHSRMGAWRARIKVDGVSHFLGYHPTLEEAVAARAAAQHLHGEFARL